MMVVAVAVVVWHCCRPVSLPLLLVFGGVGGMDCITAIVAVAAAASFFFFKPCDGNSSKIATASMATARANNNSNNNGNHNSNSSGQSNSANCK